MYFSFIVFGTSFLIDITKSQLSYSNFKKYLFKKKLKKKNFVLLDTNHIISSIYY